MRLATTAILLATVFLCLGAGAADKQQTSTAKATSHTSPTPFKAEYSATYNGMPIAMSRTLERTLGLYKATTTASNFLGSIREEESFRVDEKAKLRPTQYHYQRAILGKDRSEDTTFDRSGRRVSSTYKGNTINLDSPSPILAPLSYQMQMQLDLLQGRKDFRYTVATRGKLKDYRYKVVRQEKLQTPLGTLDTMVMERQRDDDERKTLVWLAKKFQYLPVKLIQEEDGEHYEMQIKSYAQLSE